MFWNKKESKDGLPDLPPLKIPLRDPFGVNSRSNPFSQEEKEEERVEEHPLPSFPDSPLQKSFSQVAIKDAVSEPMSSSENEEDEKRYEMDHPSSMSSMHTMEMESPQQKQPMQKSFTLESPPEESTYVPPKRPTTKTSEIFVKIDKFNSAHRSIIGIKKKIEEIDSALRRIREIKLREEQELSSWEKEISSLKSRLQEVNDVLFEQ